MMENEMHADTLESAATPKSLRARLLNYGGDETSLRAQVRALPESLKRGYVMEIAGGFSMRGKARGVMQQMADYCAAHPYHSDAFALGYDEMRRARHYLNTALHHPFGERYDGGSHPQVLAFEQCLIDLQGAVKLAGVRLPFWQDSRVTLGAATQLASIRHQLFGERQR